MGEIPWTVRRLFSLIGVASSGLGIVAFLDQYYPEWEVVVRLTGFLDQVGRLGPLVPPYQIGPVALGHVILGLLGVTLFLFLFYRPRSREERERARFRREQRQFRAEQRAFSRRVLEEVEGKLGALRAPRARRPAQVVTHSAAEVVNAPVDRVWAALRAANCGPAFEDLLDRVVPTSEEEDAVEWAGRCSVGGEVMAVEGSTRLQAPLRLEAVCRGGALRGLQTTYELEPEEGRTKITEEAVFDAGRIPEEFAALGNGLALLVQHTLKRDLQRLRDEVEALSEGKFSHEGTETSR